VDKVLEERITKGEKIMLSDGKFIERMLTIKQINSGNASKAPFYRHLVPLGQERLDALRYVIAAVFGISLSTLMFCPTKFNKAWYLCNQRSVSCHFMNSDGNTNKDLSAIFFNCQI
jgi:hypothetical protein